MWLVQVYRRVHQLKLINVCRSLGIHGALRGKCPASGVGAYRAAIAPQGAWPPDNSE